MPSNMFIRFEGPTIPGTSRLPGHESDIEILSWSHSFAQPGSRSTGERSTVEQATHQNFSLTKYLDAASNELLKMSWSGKQFLKATVTCYREGSSPGGAAIKYLEIAMQHVVISNYSISGGPGDIPVENVSLDSVIVEHTYTPAHGEVSSARHDLQNHEVS